jgi:hypothetical protein
MTLPEQRPPVIRTLLTSEANQPAARMEEAHTGVTPSQTRCDHLTGMAQQMCYASLYGVSM